MAGLTRYLQKLFGISAGSNEMAQYGSFLTTPQLYDGATITPAIIQALSNFQGGLYSAVGGAYSPTIQDQNSLFFLAFYQLSYLLTRGIPEWDSGTTYNTNDFCRVGNIIYYSLIDSNTNNNPTTSPSDWTRNIFSPTQQIFTIPGTYTTPTSPRKPLYLHVILAGGGGGGAAGGNTGGGSGGAGTASTFGSLLTANFGSGGNFAGTGGAGSSGSSISSPAYGLIQEGKAGQPGQYVETPASNPTQVSLLGGTGGQNRLSGQGLGGDGLYAQNGQAAIEATGCGGGGGGTSATAVSTQHWSGAAGGAGAIISAIIPNPDSSYLIGIGSGGAFGVNNGGGGDGGAGSYGVAIITEYYQ